MDALLGRASSRFLFVTVLPTVLLVAVVGFLLAAGAPTHPPSYTAALGAFHHASLRDVVGLATLVAVLAVALHPLQTPLIQLLEGYWLRLPMGEDLFEFGVQRHRENWSQSRNLMKAYARDRHSVPYGAVSAARFASDWMPSNPQHLLPTTLGNTLRAGEERAGSRYGMRTDIVVPRLMPLLDERHRDRLADGRNQLDAAARLCVVSLMSVAASLLLLVPTVSWLYVPLLMFFLAWGAYRSAIAAARTYCTNLAAAVDLHHLELWRALALPRPETLRDEQIRAELLSKFLAGEGIPPDEAEEIRWFTPPPT